MGVSASGKSTIGKLLASELRFPFFDADDFHPEYNIKKMASGQALNDLDREGWLLELNDLARREPNAIIACSALKEAYRILLRKDLSKEVHFVYLKGSYEQIYDRMTEREGHMMPVSLLQSQFDTLEEPSDALTVSVSLTPETIIKQIMNEINPKCDFGLIGLGVMGKSLCRNLINNDVKLAMYNRFVAGVEEGVAADFKQAYNLDSSAAFEDLEQFVESLNTPRKIMLMVSAGPAIDHIIEELVPLLDEEDIIIDGGNSHYSDTKRRMEYLNKEGVHFIGTGVSGGEEGALKGPSIMPGGNQQAYEQIKPFLEAIAAKDKNGKPCCTYIGTEGSGHFVKMVHNGIEYAEMQLLAELYQLCRFGKGMQPEQIADLFESWKAEGLDSFLLEITANILREKEDDKYLIDLILDKAGNKGTGNWTTVAASQLGFPATMITAALYARYVSAHKESRKQAASIFRFEKSSALDCSLDDMREAYRVGRIINHHQGFELIRSASDTFAWNLDLSAIAGIWTNGCIIRSELMERLIEPLKEALPILLQRDQLTILKTGRENLTALNISGLKAGFNLPCFTAALNFLNGYTESKGSANIIQAQRDYFGAHRYQRVDDHSGKTYHTVWSN
jgi:6-phosphogluconate dehydrogenase